MAEIAAKDVKALRDATGAGMMDAKKALSECNGDFEAASQMLREKGLAKAAARSDRDNVCLLYTSPSPRDRSVSRMPSSA